MPRLNALKVVNRKVVNKEARLPPPVCFCDYLINSGIIRDLQALSKET